MKYDFDKEIDRFGSASIKWDETESLFGDKDILPMWVADMDFPAPQPVIEALKKRVEQGIYGYTTRPQSYLEAIIEWMEQRHDWLVEREWICHSPGVVPGLSLIVEAFTEPGDKVIIQPPVYYPFKEVVVRHERDLVYNPLKFENGRYTMDFDDLVQKLDPDVKLLFLCSPHNPVGRVWTKEELTKLGDICIEHGVVVVADEIHFDLILKNQNHVNFASISKEFANNSIVCTAPSKTFNLAGLQTSNIIIPNEKLRAVFTKVVETHFLSHPNTFGIMALESAYRFGAEWLDQCLDYIEGNLEFLTAYMENRIPKIKVIKPEGTYLVWLDCRELGLNSKDLERLMQKEAKVAFDEGYIFGPGGEGFTRINIACPRSILKEGLSRMEAAINRLSVLEGNKK
ncbi:cystathionine beta-lyase [Scopulibacillus darangshiensis]|uniref:cysteine-S-conjugate beta-lyase n=1 Tax=Scopulibacillus darangshiensis TaxID=442528 RepID=A0A4R2NR16_9BACL|nr:MalY/PatB family protein [Scopulibacillus darangshiensis]TCP23775.1 cystathionine beta-lyase [Scopulibacillus darangshiensis]